MDKTLFNRISNKTRQEFKQKSFQEDLNDSSTLADGEYSLWKVKRFFKRRLVHVPPLEYA